MAEVIGEVMVPLATMGVSAVKRIQRGIISLGASSTTATATIAAVNKSKSQLNFLGYSGGSTSAESHIYIELVNETTVKATRNISGSNAGKVSFEVIEYY